MEYLACLLLCAVLAISVLLTVEVTIEKLPPDIGSLLIDEMEHKAFRYVSSKVNWKKDGF